MENTSLSALLVLTSWNTASDDLTSQPTRTLVKDFCENTLKSDEFSKLYCTVLDVEVSEDQKKDAESVGVTLIPATRSKWADPVEDPPVVNWLFNHNTYYQQLKDLQNIKHIVSFSPKTKNAAAAIHESLFPLAQLHQLSVPTPHGVVFAFDAWSKDACGLTGYHRAIIQDFIARKAESGEYLKAYSTVVDVELSADQIEDAEKCGVTLIKAERKKGVNEMPKVEWLVNHESHFPDLGKLQNIKYVVGYLPKTGWAAVDIQKKLFPTAKLVLINHVCQEQNCLLMKDEFSEFEQEMLQMASHSDLLFSIGPHLYGHFQSAYRAVINGRKLYDIPHKEILPKPRQQYFDNERPEAEIENDGPNILTYGQLNTEEALKRCDSIAASIGSAANKHKDLGKKPIKWKIHGVSEQAYKTTKNFLLEKLQSGHVMPKPYKQYSADSLLQSVQQSDLCLPPSCYTDYSFEGLEAMAAGLPTTVQDDSHIAAMIERHFEEHKDYCVVRNETDKLTSKINENLIKSSAAVQNAKRLKEDLAKSEAVTESLAKFASSLTDEDGKTEMKEKRQEKEMAQVNEPTTTTTNGFNTTETKELLHHKSVNKDKDRKEATAVQPGMSATEGVGTMGTTAVKGQETLETTAVKPEIQRREQIENTNPGTPSSSQSLEIALTNDSTGLVVNVELNEEPFQQKMKDLDKQEPTSSVRDEKEKVDTAWEECNGDFEKNANEVTVSEESQQTVDNNCKEHFGQVQVETTKLSSLAIHLNIPTLYNLYRLEHTCLSGSFPDSFEPLLITDKMRDEADKVGLQLKLKATYDQSRFHELELLFINRDGGGLTPVKVFDDVIEGKDAEEIQIDDEDTDQKSDTMMTGRVDSISQGQDIQSKLETERTTLESQLKEAKEEKATLEERCKELTQKLESTEQSLVSQRIGSSTEREKLQSELKENQKLIRELENTVEALHLTEEESELNKPAEEDPTIMPQQPPQHHHEMSTGHMMQASAARGPPHSPVVYSQSQQMPYPTAQPHTQGTIMGQMRPQHVQHQPNIQYTQKPQMYIPPPQGQFTSPYYQGQNPIPQEIKTSATQVYAPTLMPQQPPQHQHEMSTGHMMQAFPATGPPTSSVVYSQAQQIPYPTAQPHTQGTIMGQMRPQHVQYQPSMQPQMYISTPQGHLTPPHHQGQNLIPQEIRSSATQVYGDWSVTLVNGQHQGRGQKFKWPRGLAFHHDKLVVCDSGNNIVQILNKDYTCDKVIGSFDGQFAKPFGPWSVAISRFNHYFILDGENKQIVVCDENGKIIQIITLPENIKVVWDIALMDDFVLVTLSLTSLDISRPEDRDDRLVKYTQSGKYVKDVGGQTSVQTKLYGPVSVAVNSKNIIMVYDWGNDCIKCFDSNLNFLHQFGQSQLQRPRTESGIVGRGYIAVDEDDNVYVCGSVIVRSTGDVIREWFVKYGCDEKFICDLFKGRVSLPWYIAVMGDKIGVVEVGSDQIKVFSK